MVLLVCMFQLTKMYYYHHQESQQRIAWEKEYRAAKMPEKHQSMVR